ncbi:MAG TPA: hypothetical protein VJ652_15125 [Noviherbaspirillum sp.]|nr:hypothetical protein [Noviherbaspirillum sp.]
MSINWGGFAAGLSQGFNNGLQIGKSVRDAMKEKRLQDIREQGLAEAREAQQRYAADQVKENGLPDGKPTVQNGDTTAKAPVVTQEQSPQPSYVAEGRANPAAPTATVPDASAVPSPAPQPEPAPQTDATATTSAAPSASSTEGPSTAPAPAEAATPAPTATPVATTDAPPATTPAAVAKKFSVGGKSFDTREQAQAYAQKNAPSTLDFFLKTAAPKIQEEYVNQGDMDKALAWEKWSKDRANQKHMEEWSNAYRAAQMGDFESAANHVFNLYKGYEDGVTPLSKEVVKDKDGNVTGFNVRLKNDSTGEETTTFIDNDRLVNMGLSALSPPQMFEAAYKAQQTRAAEAKAVRLKQMEIGAEDRRMVYKEDRADKREVIKGDREEKRDQRRADRETENITLRSYLDRQDVGAKEKAQIEARVSALKSAGYGDDFINQQMPALLGIDQYKRQASPEEARRMILQERVKDPMFARKSADEQKKIIDGDMQLIYGGMSPSQATQVNPPSPASTAAGGLSQQAKPAPSAKPTSAVPQYVRDKQTGAIYQVNPDGSKTLVKGAQDANGRPLAR